MSGRHRWRELRDKMSPERRADAEAMTAQMLRDIERATNDNADTDASTVRIRVAQDSLIASKPNPGGWAVTLFSEDGQRIELCLNSDVVNALQQHLASLDDCSGA